MKTAIYFQRIFLLLPKPRFLRYLEEVFIHSWWVFLFSLICYTWLEYENKQQQVVFQELSHQLIDLKKTKLEALHQHDQLVKQINSQSDPAWVELTLIKVLGLVPDDQTKIYFSNEKD